jgi:hypothetical protein
MHHLASITMDAIEMLYDTIGVPYKHIERDVRIRV